METLTIILIAAVTAFFTALGTALGAFVGKMIERNFGGSRRGKRPKKKMLWLPIDRLLLILIGALLGLLVGFTVANRLFPPPPPPDTMLWSFDKSSESWTYFRQPQEASTNASWDAATQTLRAEFDFKNVDLSALPPGAEPRATFWVEGLNYNWTGYDKLVVDVANLDSQLLEMTFSFYVGECFYEFGDFKNIPPQPAPTQLEFSLTEAKYKTCTSDQAFGSPPNLAGINRFYLIIGTNDDPAIVKGAVLIDNIRLQKLPVEPVK